MNINWKDIKEKYINSYILFLKHRVWFIEWHNDFTGKLELHKIINFSTREHIRVCYCDLEKFFRNNMIIITYHYSINGNGFKCFIYNRQNNYEFYSTNIYIDKEDSENEAILKAFEIKEEELNNGL